MPPLPADARRSLLLYNLFAPLVFLALLPGFLLRMFRRGGFRDKFGQRLALYSAADRARFASRRWVWIHSISVGETFVALKFARAWHEREPATGILLSTTTSTGFAEARKAAADWLEPIYNPIDARPVVRRCLDTLQPERLILIEGEAWPNLLAECRRRAIPTALANARLSPRSEHRFRRFRTWTGPIFRLLDTVCVPEQDDLDRWRSLGVASASLRHTGSIKFDESAVTATRTAEFRELLEKIGVKADAPILLGGSTWAPEERALADAFLKLRAQWPDLFLILVPRHVERTDTIDRELSALGLRCTRRTAAPTPAAVLLVDVTGELRDWYSLATVVFVGKSLPGVTDTGGQNPAEPAAFGKPIVVGPHTQNFTPLIQLLRSHEAIREAGDRSDLESQLRALLASPATCHELGTKARATLDSHRGATAKTIAFILQQSRER